MPPLDRDASEDLPARNPIPIPQALGLALVLLVPVLVLYAIHAIGVPDGKGPTGFIYIDMAIYMAKAREYFDDGARWAYANPSDSGYGGPRIYFQPWSLALGGLHKLTDWDVGAIALIFWFVSALGCAYVALRLYEDRVGLEGWPEKLGLLVFFWGGGILAASGILVSVLQHGGLEIHRLEGASSFRAQVFRFDPAEGWWFLNFGRNLVFPTEAFYHLLFFACIRSILSRRFAPASLWAALTVASSPFTGIELTAILWSWLVVEVFFLENREHLVPFFLATNVILIGLVAYYIGFLNLYPEHRIVARQMSLDWGIEARHFVPAYALVGALALWGMRNLRSAATTFARPSNRLFFVWFLVAFALANHEFAIEPRQPIHFTRGYIWTSLFFLGLPAMLALFRRLSAMKLGPVGPAFLGAVVALFLADNLVWFGGHVASWAKRQEVVGLRMPPEQREIYGFLSRPEQRHHILLCNDWIESYLATAYTPLRSWASHYLETPGFSDRQRELREFFEKGVFQEEWKTHPILVLVRRPEIETSRVCDPAWAARHKLELVFENRFGRVYRRPASSAGTR